MRNSALFGSTELEERKLSPLQINRVQDTDRSVHDWYRFVLSFPPHLIQDYSGRFGLTAQHRVLDPFCGTGTTLVECKKLGIPSVGIEAHPMTHFASSVKTDWAPNPDKLVFHAEKILQAAQHGLNGHSHDSVATQLSEELENLLLANSISPLPLAKILSLRKAIEGVRHDAFIKHELLALAKILVGTASNLRFGPEVGLGEIKSDAPVFETWISEIRSMAGDIEEHQAESHVSNTVHLGDSRNVRQILKPNSIDAVITSPPYPNEKDYTRTTRLESVLLGFIKDKTSLQALKRTLVRSNTRNIYKGDDDDSWITNHPEILKLADTIEARRLELGKTSGFEKMYSKVTRLYFGGMARHLAELRHVLRPGAQLAYVVGDQASFFRIMIRTGAWLMKIAESLGYEPVGLDLFRTRFSTATGEQLREEVVVLRWNGFKSNKPA